MAEAVYRSEADLAAGLAEIRRAPRDVGSLVMIVRRLGAVGQREVLGEGQLDGERGLVGDRWANPKSEGHRGSPANVKIQLTIMNCRVARLLAGPEEFWPPAGDQLFVDFDLSIENLPVGTRLQIGEAIVEVSCMPHNGCRNFSARFGPEALAFVNSPEGKALRLRGMYATIEKSSTIRPGDTVRKL